MVQQSNKWVWKIKYSDLEIDEDCHVWGGAGDDLLLTLDAQGGDNWSPKLAFAKKDGSECPLHTDYDKPICFQRVGDFFRYVSFEVYLKHPNEGRRVWEVKLVYQVKDVDPHDELAAESDVLKAMSFVFNPVHDDNRLDAKGLPTDDHSGGVGGGW